MNLDNITKCSKSKLAAVFIAAFFVFYSIYMVFAYAETDGWQIFKPPDGRFRVLMPGKPRLSLKRDKTPIGEIISHIYVYENTTISLTAEFSDLPGIAVIFGGRRRVYAESRTAFLEDVKGKMLCLNDIKLDAYKGKEILYKTSSQIGKARFLLIGNRLYVIQASVNEGSDTSLIDKYFQSFKPIYRKARQRHARLQSAES